MSEPIICFGQQPCGFFPKRFLVAKMQAARRLQKEIGGEIVFFYHDSDHDPRETKTILRGRKNGEESAQNFTFENKLQRKFSPLYAKRLVDGWQANTARQLGNYVDKPLIEIFKKIEARNIADFCLDMYREMGLIDGMRIVRSGDAALRSTARDISDYFVDVKHEGEIVRARFMDGALKLHEGGNSFTDLPMVEYDKSQISPTRDTRLGWMQSIIHCTHYVSGAGEQAYLNKADAPEIEFVMRDEIEASDEAYTDGQYAKVVQG